MTPSSRPTTPEMTRPRRTLAQPKRSASCGRFAASDCATSVAVAVPNAMQAVKVSLRIATMFVVAAPFTASRTPVGEAAASAASSLPATCAKRPKPIIITTVASAAGIESLRMSQVSDRERFDQRRNEKRARSFPTKKSMIPRPIHVATNAAKPAPGAPIRGAPRFPKMNIQQKRMLKMFITTAETRCTHVLPMPSKNAFSAIVPAIETMPRRRHFEYEYAIAWASGTLRIIPSRSWIVHAPTIPRRIPAMRQKNAEFARTAPAAS